jgi:uncharacterized Ntn-hydrolase superfamily protein
MNDIIQNLELNATNGRENFCYINEKQLNAMKELSKREAEENKQLKMQISAREEGCNRLEKNWNKLKEYINKMHEYFLYTDVNEIYKQSMKLDNQFPHLFNLSELNASDRILSSICKKIQELEQGSDKNE